MTKNFGFNKSDDIRRGKKVTALAATYSPLNATAHPRGWVIDKLI